MVSFFERLCWSITAQSNLDRRSAIKLVYDGQCLGGAQTGRDARLHSTCLRAKAAPLSHLYAPSKHQQPEHHHGHALWTTLLASHLAFTDQVNAIT